MRGKELTVREVALDTLLEWEQKEAYSNLLLHQVLEQSNLNEKDQRLLTELVYGSIQRLNTIDWILDRLIKKGVFSLDVWVRYLLRLSIYQLVFLDKIPEHAAVYESVKIARKRGHKGISGFVNGVLRSYLRQKGTLLPSKEPETLIDKEIRYSHPGWFIQRMEELYGIEETARLCIENNLPPNINVRVNLLKGTRDQWIKKWIENTAGDAAPSSLCPEGAVVLKGGNPARTSVFKEGYCTLQDGSSTLVARILNPESGMNVLDACAAPGGKTTHIAELMKNEGSILACDMHSHKIKLITANATRLGITIIKTKVHDARKLHEEIDEQFDAILLDAPCSGLGVIRRKPDIKWTKTAKEIDVLVEIQKELLQKVSLMLKPGGTLVYSTCTTEVRENQEQVHHFLANHPDFSWLPFHDLLSEDVKENAILQEGWLQILPHHFGTDGFFIAKLKKNI